MDDNFRSYIGTLPFDGTFCAAYMRWLYFPFFDYHIANSEYTAAELRSAAQGHLVPRGTWIRHMGVNLQRFSPARRSRALPQRLLQNFGAPEASVLLLYVGRLVPEKNLPLLIDLLAHLAHNGRSDFRLLVVGDGIERAKWDADAGQRAPGRALFFGHIKDQNILADLYANADLFVHPNPHEPFGIAPLEAMASGLPLIAPDSGGITSYANSGNAWTVAPTVEQFSAAVHDALSSEELRAAKTRAALRTAGQYEWTSVASSFLDLYTKMQRASRNAAEALPAPAFTSSTASRLRSTLLRGVAASVASTFKLFSNLRSDSRAGSMQRPASVCDWKAGRRTEP
jgi:glycosyltransferase involved in cell wall biosynthesis